MSEIYKNLRNGSKRKRENSIGYDEMRPFIKEIESLKSENYLLKQAIKSSKNESSEMNEECKITLQNEEIEKLKSEKGVLEDKITELQVQVDHEKHFSSAKDLIIKKISNKFQILENEGEQLQADKNEMNLRNIELQTTIDEVNDRLETTTYAKNLVSMSLQQMIEDYKSLNNSYVEQTAYYMREMELLRYQITSVESQYRQALEKVSDAAKTQLQKLFDENTEVKRQLGDVAGDTDKALVSIIKCGICLEHKSPAEFTVTVPCGHMHCLKCVENLKAQKKTKSRNCETCRAKMSCRVNVFV